MTRHRTNYGAIYEPKECAHCGESYIPTSGRQQVCQKDECRNWKARNYPSRKNGRYVKRGVRPERKKCEWPDCDIIFDVAAMGLVPKTCAEHTREAANATSIVKRSAWSLKTIDAVCGFRFCENLQHPIGRGWCYRHYPIWSVHGVTAEKWWHLFADQNGVCPVCAQDLFDGRVIVVDHDHALAVGPRHTVDHVRGLLHDAPCNGMILGGIETAIENGWFENALDYIQFPRQESNLP